MGLNDRKKAAKPATSTLGGYNKLRRIYEKNTHLIYRIKSLQESLTTLSYGLEQLKKCSDGELPYSELALTLNSQDASGIQSTIDAIMSKLADDNLKKIDRLLLHNNLLNSQTGLKLQEIITSQAPSDSELTEENKLKLYDAIDLMESNQEKIYEEISHIKELLPGIYNNLSQLRRSLITEEDNNEFLRPNSKTHLTRLYIELQAICLAPNKPSEEQWLMSITNLLHAYSIYMKEGNAGDRCDFLIGDNTAQAVLNDVYELLNCDALMTRQPKSDRPQVFGQYAFPIADLSSPIAVADTIAVQAQIGLNNRHEKVVTTKLVATEEIQDDREQLSGEVTQRLKITGELANPLNYTDLSSQLLIARAFYVVNNDMIQAIYMRILDGYSRTLNSNEAIKNQGKELLKETRRNIHIKLKEVGCDADTQFQLTLMEGVCCLYLAKIMYQVDLKIDDLVAVKNLLKFADACFNQNELDACLTDLSYSSFVMKCNDEVLQLLMMIRKEELTREDVYRRLGKQHNLEAEKNRRYLREAMGTKEGHQDIEGGKLAIYIVNRSFDFFQKLKRQKYHSLLIKGFEIYGGESKNYRAVIYCLSMYRYHTRTASDTEYSAELFKLREFAKFVLADCYTRVAHEIPDDKALSSFYYLVAEKLYESIMTRSDTSYLKITANDGRQLPLAEIAFQLRQTIRALLNLTLLKSFTVTSIPKENSLITDEDIAPLCLAQVNFDNNYLPAPEVDERQIASPKGFKISSIFKGFTAFSSSSSADKKAEADEFSDMIELAEGVAAEGNSSGDDPDNRRYTATAKAGGK